MSDRFDHKLEHKLETKPAEGDATARDVRRIELISGTGRRRRWSSDDKVRIVVESFTPGANVSDVARRHGMSPQQLFAWRREACAMFADTAEVATTPARPEPAPVFAQVVLAAPATAPPSAPPSPKGNAPGTIEIVIGDATVRVIGQVASEAIAAALRALRRSS
jgi:transposase